MTGTYKHRVIVINRAALDSADEEIVLVHIYLDTGRSSVEILEGLRTMLQQGANGEDKMETKSTLSYVHHLWVTFTIGTIEQVQDLFFKRFTVFVNCLPGLNGSLVIE